MSDQEGERRGERQREINTERWNGETARRGTERDIQRERPQKPETNRRRERGGGTEKE